MDRRGLLLHNFVYLFSSNTTHSNISVQFPAKVWIGAIIINIILYSTLNIQPNAKKMMSQQHMWIEYINLDI